MDETEVKECVNHWWRLNRDNKSIRNIPTVLIHLIFLYIEFLWKRLNKGDQGLVVCTERIGYNCYTYQAVTPLLERKQIVLNGSNGFYPYQFGSCEIFISIIRNKKQIPFYYFGKGNNNLLNFGLTTYNSSVNNIKTYMLPVAVGIHLECSHVQDLNDNSIDTTYFVAPIRNPPYSNSVPSSGYKHYCGNFFEGRIYFNEDHYVYSTGNANTIERKFIDPDDMYYLFVYIFPNFKNFSIDIGIREYEPMWSDMDTKWGEKELRTEMRSIWREE